RPPGTYRFNWTASGRTAGEWTFRVTADDDKGRHSVAERDFTVRGWPLRVPVAGVTSSLTSLIGDHGVYAVFLLMIVAAVLPAASELTMLYAGAVAAGAFPDAQVVLFGHEIKSHGGAYVVMSLAGLLGNVVGAAGGWTIGRYAEVWLERHGRLLHVTRERLDRAKRWFDRFGSVAVPAGFMTPGIRSFVAIPAGIGRVPFFRFLGLAAIGCAV